MAFTPILMSRNGVSQTADSPAEYYKLIWNGWTAGGPPPPPDPASVPATLKVVRDELAPVKSAVEGRLSQAALAATLRDTSGRVTMADVERAWVEDGVPIWVPHSGNNLGYGPDGTWEWYESAAASGARVLDFDVRSMLGCTTDLALVHNTTVDFNSTLSGPVSDFTPAALRKAPVDASTWFRQGYSDSVGFPSFVDIVSRYGNRFAYMVEIKDRPTSDPDPLPILIAIAERFGIKENVNICSSNYETCVEAAAAGFETSLVASAAQIAGRTPQQMLADGIRWLDLQGASYVNDKATGVSAGAASDAVFQQFINGGVHVIAWTLARQFEAQKYLALGCAGAFISSPYTTGDVSLYRRTTDPLVTNRQYVAPFLTNYGTSAPDDTYSDDARGVFGNGRHKSSVGGGANDHTILQAYLSPVATPTSYTLNVEYVHDAPHANQGQGYGLYVGATTDRPMFGTTTNQVYQFYYRGNGGWNIYRYSSTGTPSLTNGTWAPLLAAPPVLSGPVAAGSAITTLPVVALPAAIPAGARLLLPTTGGPGNKAQVVTVAAGGAAAGATSVPIAAVTPTSAVASGASLPQVVPLRVIVTPTAITMTRLDTNESMTTTDTTFRGGYIFFRKNGGGSGSITWSYQNAFIS